MLEPIEALERLREGNRRFVNQGPDCESLSRHGHSSELVNGQHPFATILGCSDSRVPVEIVFDQGLGDLFVIRVAGNIVAPSQIGSIEFAAEYSGTKLVVVMGHSGCGAIQATIDTLLKTGAMPPRNLYSIVERIRPSVEGLLETELRHDRTALVHHAVRANIRACASHVRHGSREIEQMVESGQLLVVGAEYSLETGHVDFFEGVPST